MSSPNQIALNQTDSPEFKAWFGDSQVVDGDGAPLLVYHGTRPGNDIKTFKVPNDYDGIYFTPDLNYAESYTSELFEPDKGAGSIYPTYLHITNPFIVRAADTSEEWQNFVNRGMDLVQLKAQGYDGAILKDEKGVIDQIMVFEATQIRSVFDTFEVIEPSLARTHG